MKLPCHIGRYTLLEKIASGGMSEVYRASLGWDDGFEKTVAIKRLLPNWGGDDELRDMLIDEARVLVSLQHQAIVQVFELGSFEGLPFLAMEYVDGIDCARLLTCLIREETPLPVPHAVYIISQMLVALEFAHRSTDAAGRPLGLVHRDISPSNILLSWNGEVKVTDFGIAKGIHRTRGTQVGRIKGKYAYMSPEQARGREVDARSDLFSCGIVFFELLTARRLFSARSDLEILEKVKNAKVPDDVVQNLRPDLATILFLSLAIEPGSRYQSAAEMLADVQKYASSKGIMSSSVDLSTFLRERFPREGPKKPKAAEVAPELEMHKTKVMDDGRSARGAVFRRAASVALLLSCAVCLKPAKFIENVSVPTAQAENRAVKTGITGPPKTGGSIAIDSSPVTSEGMLVVRDERRRIKTPFSLDGIEVGEGVNCRLELEADGYGTVTEQFRLLPSQPVFARNFELKRALPATISVQARPWGLVDIPGYVSGRETPVGGVRVKAGTYLVNVRYPPLNMVATAKVEIGDGQSKKCLATFEERPVLSCR